MPPEAVLKEDLLRTGIAFDDAALSDNLDGAVKPKSYFIFSFDQKPLAELGEAASAATARGDRADRRARTGCGGRSSRCASTRRRPTASRRAAWSSRERELADVELPPMPAYYRHELSNGKTVMETAPTIQWGYLIYLTVLRLCQYFGAKEECRFCDINHNWRQHKQAGRPYTGIKPVEDVLEALAIIAEHDDGASHAYTLTGGSVTSKVDGLAEADFYGRYAQAIEERFPGRWIGKVVAQALPREDVQRYKDYGISIYHPNYEVWDERLFSIICPGKERYVGRAEWHRRILDAAEVFGPRLRDPELRRGCRDGEAVRVHVGRGGDRLARARGSSSSCRAGSRRGSRRGARSRRRRSACDNPDGAPLEYHVRLLETYRDVLEGNGLQPPPGYGEPGAGNAVFSVSSFMDVLVGEGAGVTRISVDEARELWLRGDDEELQRLAQEARARLAPARPRDLHGHADHQLHERLCCPVRLLRVLRPARTRRAATCSRARTCSRRSTSCSRSAATSSGSTAASTRSCRSTTTATCSRSVRERYGERVEFYALTVAEFVFLADRAGLSYAEAAARLRDAGVHWVTGGGSEILTEDFRKRHAKWKYTVADYFEAQRAIVESGMQTTATMVIGFDETLDERLEHLQRTRDFQDEIADGTACSRSCAGRTSRTAPRSAARRSRRDEYRRWIALSRIFLDNVKHVRTSVLTQNEDAFRALDYGADDFDLPIEDEVTQKAGATIDLDLERAARGPAPARLHGRVPARRAPRPGR